MVCPIADSVASAVCPWVGGWGHRFYPLNAACHRCRRAIGPEPMTNRFFLVSFAGRRPCLLRRTCYSGFSGAAMSRPGSHPRRTARLRRPPPSQAQKNATSSAFFTHAISAPLAPLMRARGQGQKNPTADRGAALAQYPDWYRWPVQSQFSRSPEVFRASSRHQAGCGGGRAMNAAEGALLSVCEGAATRGEACDVGATRVRARPGRRSTLKTAGGRPQAAVDPRREVVMTIAFFALFI